MYPQLSKSVKTLATLHEWVHPKKIQYTPKFTTQGVHVPSTFKISVNPGSIWRSHTNTGCCKLLQCSIDNRFSWKLPWAWTSCVGM